jgi:hypothetical protein
MRRWHRHSCLCPRLMHSMQSTQARVSVPPLRSQNRPRMGRGDRDGARVRGAPRRPQPSKFSGRELAEVTFANRVQRKYNSQYRYAIGFEVPTWLN